MSPRPRTVSDGQLLAGARRAISRVGADRVTLAHVGRAAGIAPATVVQRFGSKQRLLRAVLENDRSRLREAWAGGRKGGTGGGGRTPTLAGRLSALIWDALAPVPGTPLANLTAFFQMAWGSPELRDAMASRGRELERIARRLVAEAMVRAELGPVNPNALARLLLATGEGALGRHAGHTHTTARRAITRHLRTVLTPYLRRRRSKRVTRRRKAR